MSITIFFLSKGFILTKGRGGGKTPPLVVDLLKKAVTEKSQYAVSKETGLGLATINSYLKGVGEPTNATLEKLAVYFKVSAVVLRSEVNSYDPEVSSTVLDSIESALVTVLKMLITTDQEISNTFYASALASACKIVSASNALTSILNPDHLSEVQTVAKVVIKAINEYKDNNALESTTKEIINQMLTSYVPPYPKFSNKVQKWAANVSPAIIDASFLNALKIVDGNRRSREIVPQLNPAKSTLPQRH
jgi:transcriptional regulator with XRE-family HTH domain